VAWVDLCIHLLATVHGLSGGRASSLSSPPERLSSGPSRKDCSVCSSSCLFLLQATASDSRCGVYQCAIGRIPFPRLLSFRAARFFLVASGRVGALMMRMTNQNYRWYRTRPPAIGITPRSFTGTGDPNSSSSTALVRVIVCVVFLALSRRGQKHALVNSSRREDMARSHGEEAWPGLPAWLSSTKTPGSVGSVEGRTEMQSRLNPKSEINVSQLSD
jgi:hypothetical protein